MGIGLHTAYKFRHFSNGRLVWASGLGEMDGRISQADESDVSAVIHEQPWELNELTQQGEQSMLDVYYRGSTPPTEFFFRLFNDTPLDNDTLVDLTGEVTGTGYAPIAVARNTTDWPSLALDAGDYVTTTIVKTFTATAPWTAATHLILSTSSDNTGLLVAFAALSATRTLNGGDTLDVSMAVKLS